MLLKQARNVCEEDVDLQCSLHSEHSYNKINIITINANTVIFLKGGKKIYTIWLCSCIPGRFYDRLKNLSRHFVHMELFNIFVLFTLDCRTVACKNIRFS